MRWGSDALHGKLFVDEGGDMTHLEQAKPQPDRRPLSSATRTGRVAFRRFPLLD